MLTDYSKRFYWLVWISILLLIGGYIGAKPAYHWYADRKAVEIVEEIYRVDLPKGDWNSVARKLRLASGFSYRAPQVLRLTAQVLAAAEKSDSLLYYARLLETKKATVEDRLEYARQALRFNRPDVARTLVREVLTESPMNLEALLIGITALERLGMTEDATRLAESTLRAHPQNEEAILRLGTLQFSRNDEASRKEGRSLLWGLAIGQSKLATAAVEQLARETKLGREEMIILSKAMAYQTNRTLAQDLILYDLRSRMLPENERGGVASLVIQRLGEKATLNDRLAAADWLLTHQQASRIGEVLSEAEARQSNPVAERWIQARADQGKWVEAADLVEDMTLPISPTVRNCYRAVIQNQAGNTNAVINHLTQAVNSLTMVARPSGANFRKASFTSGDG